MTSVDKSYGAIKALSGVCLSIEAGEIVSLLGRNGAGKTTLVSIVAGLLRPTNGEVVVGGISVSSDPLRAQRLIGLAPQKLSIYPTLSVRQNLRAFGSLAGLKRRDLVTRSEEVAEALELGPLLSRRAGTLSGGEARRLHTGIALLGNPPLLLLDEPTVGADVESRRDLLDLVRHQASRGAAVCYTTHYMAEAEEISTRVVILDAGEVAAEGSVDDLIARHSRPLVFLRFDGPPPNVNLGRVLDRQENSLQLECDAVEVTLAKVLDATQRCGSKLLSVDVQRPGLEAVFASSARGEQCPPWQTSE